MLFRILTVRKHKKITFCDAYSFDGFRQQLAFDNEMVDESVFVTGCVVDLRFHRGLNKRGESILFVDSIEKCIVPDNSTSYKGYQKGENTCNPELTSFAQDLNGGIHLSQFHFRLVFIQRLKSLLQDLGIYETYTPLTNANRGTNIASPVRAVGLYTGTRYVKITHELGLKTQSYLSLAPLFEIGYVMRDRYTTKSGMNEFLTLEAVIPTEIDFDLCAFYLKVLRLSIQTAEELGLEHNSIFDDIEIIDLKREYANAYSQYSPQNYASLYEKTVSNNRHCILVNAAIETPLGISDKNNMVMETKWVLDGHGLGHGYLDEYRSEKLREAFLIQQGQLKNMGIDADLPEEYLKAIEYAGIPTFSFNLGIDRFINCFFGAQLE